MSARSISLDHVVRGEHPDLIAGGDAGTGADRLWKEPDVEAFEGGRPRKRAQTLDHVLLGGLWHPCPGDNEHVEIAAAGHELRGECGAVHVAAEQMRPNDIDDRVSYRVGISLRRGV